MDIYGIGVMLKGGAEICFRAGRRTGRTAHMLNNLKDGDVVVFVDRFEAERVRRICLERGLKVKCLVYPPELRVVAEKCREYKRVVFDHTWVEVYYLDSIERAARELEAVGEFVMRDDGLLNEVAFKWEKR